MLITLLTGRIPGHFRSGEGLFRHQRVERYEALHVQTRHILKLTNCASDRIDAVTAESLESILTFG
jgi:hypothetical protein